MPLIGYKAPFTDAFIRNAPESAGVYALYKNGQVTYYGRAQGGSVTIRSRLASHKAGYEGPCTQSSVEFNYEVTSYPVTRERELLEEHQRIYGRLPACNDRIG